MPIDPTPGPASAGRAGKPADAAPAARLTPWLHLASGLFECIPYSAIALLARLSVAGVFWRSGQTKVEGFALDLVEGRVELGWPRLSDSAVALFRDEYRLPLLSPELGASLAALGEHALPLLLLLGLGTRLSAFGLLGMTAVIQLLVYPGAWPTHGTWAALMLMLMAQGAGAWSLDHLLGQRSASAVRPVAPR
jgi:putative oxidoreductase